MPPTIIISGYDLTFLGLVPNWSLRLHLYYSEIAELLKYHQLKCVDCRFKALKSCRFTKNSEVCIFQGKSESSPGI